MARGLSPHDVLPSAGFAGAPEVDWNRRLESLPRWPCRSRNSGDEHTVLVTSGERYCRKGLNIAARDPAVTQDEVFRPHVGSLWWSTPQRRARVVLKRATVYDMAAEMDQLARTMLGFVDVKAYEAEDGERLTVVWWRDDETLKAWREHARHRVAQRAGRDQWDQYYKMDVATVTRSRQFEREVARFHCSCASSKRGDSPSTASKQLLHQRRQRLRCVKEDR
jgi:heme-degrading monooxygenase HmoA